MSDFTIKASDLLPIFTDTLTNSDGSAVNLSGCTVAFVLRDQTSATVKVNVAATVVSAPAGTVSYTWAGTDTNTPGRYDAEWVVTNGAGKLQTFPQVGYRTIVIEETLSSTSLPLRLVTLADVKADLNYSPTDNSNDQQLIRKIDAARAVVENITGPVVPVTKTKVFNGSGTTIVLPDRFVESISLVTEVVGMTAYTLTEQPLGSPTDSYGYTWDRTSNTIVRRSFGGTRFFPPGTNNVSVTYVAGCAVIPANVREATLTLVRHWWQQGNQGSALQLAGVPDSDATPNTAAPYAVPNRVKELLAPSRRFPAVG